MHGLSQIHLENKKGVVYKVKVAEDVLFNEVRLLYIYNNVQCTYFIAAEDRMTFPAYFAI